jgi:hypothetical protein
MADLMPLVQLPDVSALAAAVAALLCTVLGSAQIVDGVVSAVVDDEPGAVERVLAAIRQLSTDDATRFEQARWAAASRAGKHTPHSAVT